MSHPPSHHARPRALCMLIFLRDSAIMIRREQQAVLPSGVLQSQRVTFGIQDAHSIISRTPLVAALYERALALADPRSEHRGIFRRHWATSEQGLFDRAGQDLDALV